MTLAEFEAEFRANVVYEGIYDDTEGRRIVVIRMLELYALVNPKCCCGEPWRLNTVHREKTPCFSYVEHEWVGLTQEEVEDSYNADYQAQTKAIEDKLKEKNT